MFKASKTALPAYLLTRIVLSHESHGLLCTVNVKGENQAVAWTKPLSDKGGGGFKKFLNLKSILLPRMNLYCFTTYTIVLKAL